MHSASYFFISLNHWASSFYLHSPINFRSCTLIMHYEYTLVKSIFFWKMKMNVYEWTCKWTYEWTYMSRRADARIRKVYVCYVVVYVYVPVHSCSVLCAILKVLHFGAKILMKAMRAGMKATYLFGSLCYIKGLAFRSKNINGGGMRAGMKATYLFSVLY